MNSAPKPSTAFAHRVRFLSVVRVLLVPLFLVSALGILPNSASAQTGRDMGYGFCTKHKLNYKGSDCPSCANSSSGSSSTPYQGPNIWNMLRERKEKARQQKLTEAWNANHEGIEFAKKEDWSNAIARYEASLRKNPDDDTVRKNLTHAKARFANSRGQNAYNKSDWTTAIACFKEALAVNPYPDNVSVYQGNLDLAQTALQNEQAHQADKVAAAGMQQAISNFAKDLNSATVASGGLDFDGRNSGKPAGGGGLDFISPVPPPGSTKPTGLEFGDPMVVDARDVPSGLPKTVAESIPATPAGNRIRKGFQAIVDHDWHAALLWFQDAYNREPGDPGLQRLIDLAQFTLDPQTKKAAPPVDPDQPKSAPALNPASNPPDPRADWNPNLIPMTRNNSVARSVASQMAAESRVNEVYAELRKKYGSDIPSGVRLSSETNLKMHQARTGEGLSPEKRRAQLEEALTEYLKTHKTYDLRPVGGSTAAEEVILGGKG